MELGIRGRRAIICASSRGLGRACAQALASEGVDIVINGRDPERLERTAEEIRSETMVTVSTVAADISTEAGRNALLAACADPDILVTNNGGPPPTPFLELEEMEWMDAIEANMLAAVSLIRAVLGEMRRRKFGRIVNITSAMVTTPWAGMAISSGPRAGLTAICKSLSREVAKDNVTINNLLPERFDTDRQAFMAECESRRDGVSLDQARAAQVASIPAGRLGRPDEFGATCALFCSARASFASGLNIHLDGGAYPGLV